MNILGRIADLQERAMLMRACGYTASALVLEERYYALAERAARMGLL